MIPPVAERIWGVRWRRLLAGDAAALLLLSGLALASLKVPGREGRPERAEVLSGGRAVAVLDLGQDRVSEVPGPLGATRLEVRGGRVRVLSSPCPHQVCRHGGWIGEPGDLLVCLPNAVVVRIPGRRAAAPDALSR